MRTTRPLTHVLACLVTVTMATVKESKSGKPPIAGPPRPAYVFIGPNSRIAAVTSDPERPGARTEISMTIGPTYVRETPEEVATAPCVERRLR